MRIQQLLTITSLLLTGNLALGETLDKDDVPTRCWNVCGPVVGISHQCDNKFDNDAKQRDCICQWKQAPTLVPLCEACITQYHNGTRVGDNDRDHDDDNDNDHDDDNDNDHDHDHDHDHDGKRKRNAHNKRDNDANEILRDCKFSTTSYTPNAATSAVGSASTLAPRVTASATSSSASSSGGSGGSGSSSAGASSSSNGVTPDSMASGFAPRAAPLAAIVGLMALVLM